MRSLLLIMTMYQQGSESNTYFELSVIVAVPFLFDRYRSHFPECIVSCMRQNKDMHSGKRFRAE